MINGYLDLKRSTKFRPEKVHKIDNYYCNYLELDLPKSALIVH